MAIKKKNGKWIRTIPVGDDLKNLWLVRLILILPFSLWIQMMLSIGLGYEMYIVEWFKFAFMLSIGLWIYIEYNLHKEGYFPKHKS